MNSRYFTREEMYETLSKKKTAQLPKNAFGTSFPVRIHKYKNMAVYEGGFHGGFRQGKGKMKWKDKAFYEGDWVLGYAHGHGTFRDSLGNTYEGSFDHSMAHGNGKYVNTLGATHEGEWRFDR